MSDRRTEDTHRIVRDNYAATAKRGGCCGPDAPPSCAPPDQSAVPKSRKLGYSDAELGVVPEGSNMGLGCGNPTAIASLKPGEVVLDLGSGGGFDCFLAARRVGQEGKVIGIDMTPEMIELARENARKGSYANVEFRLGEIEHLPVADDSVDVVISNCVINLSPDKAAVFREVFRVLKPSGRLCVSDIVATKPLPEELTLNPATVSCCIGGAEAVDDLVGWMEQAGLGDVRVEVNEASRAFIADWAPGRGDEEYVVSATIEATKP